MKFVSARLSVLLIFGVVLLFALSSKVQATWSGPTYHVIDLNNYYPHTYNTTQTPEGCGTTDYINSPCTGNVTATFTWTPPGRY